MLKCSKITQTKVMVLLLRASLTFKEGVLLCSVYSRWCETGMAWMAGKRIRSGIKKNLPTRKKTYQGYIYGIRFFFFSSEKKTLEKSSQVCLLITTTHWVKGHENEHGWKLQVWQHGIGMNIEDALLCHMDCGSCGWQRIGTWHKEKWEYRNRIEVLAGQKWDCWCGDIAAS